MYELILERLRYCATESACEDCPYARGKNTIQTCIRDTMNEAADAIEFFSNRLCDACGVCSADKRNPFNCEIAGTDV